MPYNAYVQVLEKAETCHTISMCSLQVLEEEETCHVTSQCLFTDSRESKHLCAGSGERRYMSPNVFVLQVLEKAETLMYIVQVLEKSETHMYTV